MDSLINAAARALAAGDPLGALGRVALREDAPALALRGIAMAQLGDLSRARQLLRRAGRAFGPREIVARARCMVAESEIALAARDLAWPPKALATASASLDAHGDAVNAAHARYLILRRHLLLGEINAAETFLRTLDPRGLPAYLRAIHDLLAAGIAMRRLQSRAASRALARAARAAAASGIAALAAEIALAQGLLEAPAARRIAPAPDRLLNLAGVARVLASGALVVDACRNVVVGGNTTIPFTGRPILFSLLRALAEAAPGSVARHDLIARVFGGRAADESHRARLRVEIARLRAKLRGLAAISATPVGFALEAGGGHRIVVLARPGAEEHAWLLALLADGEAWSSSAIALAMGRSQRSVQRALDTLRAADKVQTIGHGRARRWMMPAMPGASAIATTLLLTAPLPGG